MNKLTKETYIGATIKNLISRRNDHLQKAKKGYNGRFQKAIHTYGENVFEWHQIDTANSANELAEKEKQYIIKYKSKEKGYNGDRGGGLKKNIYQYDLVSGVILSSFSSLTEAAENVGVNKKTISKACLGEIKNCKGYSWSYILADNFYAEPDKRKKKVFQFNEKGVFLRSYDSVAEASEITNVNKTSIAKCCRGDYKIAGDFCWKYED